MSDFTFAFRRLTKALMVPVVNVPTVETAIAVPDGFIKPSYKAFQVFNPNTSCVALRGTSWPPGTPKPTVPNIAEIDDWNFMPGFTAVYSTQNPIFMSAFAFATPIYPDVASDEELVPLRVWYGMGV